MLDEFLTSKIHQSIHANLIKGTVKAVTGDTCTVTPFDGADIHRVQFRALIDDSDFGLMIVPSVGSSVIVGIINNNENDGFIVSYSKIDSFQVKSENTFVKIDKNGIEINGASQAIVRGNELKGELEKEKIRLTTLINAISNAAVVASDGGSAFKTNILTGIAGIQSGNYSSILSDKVKTG